MVRNYNIKSVWDYINGFDIENVEEFENNYKFMIDVIRISKDKKMYYLCSDDVKNNYEFVKFMIYNFKNDIEFIDEVARYYLDNVDDKDITYKELNFIMCEILQNSSNKYEYVDYFTTRAIICSTEKLIIDSFINGEDSSIYKNKFGLGFLLVLCDEIGESDVITRYMAKEYLEDIFYGNNITLEDLVHREAKGLDNLKEIGIKNFIIDYVSRYDSELSSYLQVHIELVKSIEKRIVIICNNWNNYVCRMQSRKDNIFFQETCELIEKYHPNFSYSEICYFIDNKLNLPVNLCSYDADNVIELIDINKFSLCDYKCFKMIIELAKEIYLSPVINMEMKKNDEFIDSESKKNNNDNKILRLIPKNMNDN